MHRAKKILQHCTHQSKNKNADVIFVNVTNSEEDSDYSASENVFNVTEVVCCVFGCQGENNMKKFKDELVNAFSNSAYGPTVVERASHNDVEGIKETIIFGYWNDHKSFDEWNRTSTYRSWIQKDERLAEESGYFQEVFYINLEDYETLHSSGEHAPSSYTGFSKQAIGLTASENHGFWGSARRRIKSHVRDDFVGEDIEMIQEKQNTKGGRYRVRVPCNTCIIRSGQDLTTAVQEEKEVYLNELHPVLSDGMQYIIDHPVELGCLSHRFISDETLDGVQLPKTAGFGYFKDMKYLEEWAKEHETHLKIFFEGGRLLAAGKLSSLFLWHEVYIVKRGYAEYVNCHNKTGLLRWMKGL